MPRTPGHERRIMLGLYKKEVTYNAGTAVTATEACEMSGFDSEPRDWPDEVVDDAGEMTGSEFPTTQEILRQGVTLPYSEPKAKPNSLAGLGALVMGTIVSTQDAALIAYRHKITPAATATPLPTIRAEVKDGTQWGFNGILGNSLKISGKENGFIGIEAALVGSGTRATSAAAFPAKISESWLKTTQMKIWLETGAQILIDAVPTQDAENISSATPDDLKLRIKSFEWEWDNAPYLNFGYGSAVLQEADKGPKRSCKLSFSLLYDSDAELTYYTGQELAAIEFDAKGALIAAGGTMFFGMSLIVPAFKLKKIGLKGKSGDFLSQDFEATILSDGVNPVSTLFVYNAKTGYLA